MNDFEKITENYSESSFKPDKQYSMLPTILSLLDLDKRCKVIDVGCGDGFFTYPISILSESVVGIDTSKKQLSRAIRRLNIEYCLADMHNYDYPECDRISCPFVLNYIDSLKDLTRLFSKFYDALKKNGKLVSILDNPPSVFQNCSEFGSIKRVKDDTLKEGSIIEIELIDKGKKLVTLKSIFHQKDKVERSLIDAGFEKFYWSNPLVSEKGLLSFGKDFWKKYLEVCDVSYLVAEK